MYVTGGALCSRLHAQGTIDANHFAVDVPILEDVLCEGCVLIGDAQPGGEGNLCCEVVLQRVDRWVVGGLLIGGQANVGGRSPRTYTEMMVLSSELATRTYRRRVACKTHLNLWWQSFEHGRKKKTSCAADVGIARSCVVATCTTHRLQCIDTTDQPARRIVSNASIRRMNKTLFSSLTCNCNDAYT